MDLEKTKGELLDWLAQVKFPNYPGKGCWDDCIQTYPAAKGDEKLDEGLKIRLSLLLYTKTGRYVVSLMECLDPTSRETYILTCHMGWKEQERQIQEHLEQSYMGSFADVLKARHTLWVQTFKQGELGEAMDSCARAILGEELVGEPVKKETGERLSVTPSRQTVFPGVGE